MIVAIIASMSRFVVLGLLPLYTRAYSYFGLAEFSPRIASHNIRNGFSRWRTWQYGDPVDGEVDVGCEGDWTVGSPKPIDSTEDGNMLFEKFSAQEVTRAIEELEVFCVSERKDTLRRIASERTDNVRMVFENPSMLSNVWAALRTFDSFAIQNVDVILGGNYKRTKNMNTALGSQKWLTLQQHSSITDCAEALRKEGYVLFATDLNEESKPIEDINWSKYKKIAVIMGNEKFGITDEARALADHTFHIPMRGFAESLNLSAASAVICANLRNAGAMETTMDEEKKSRVLLSWLARSVKGSKAILRSKGFEVNGHRVFNTIGKVTTKP